MIRTMLLALAFLVASPAAWAAPQPGAPRAAAPLREAPPKPEELPAAPKPTRNEDGTYSVRLPLSSLSPVKNTTLMSSNDSFLFAIPIPERWEVKEASITFGYVNSSTLLARLSRLTVRLGGRVLGQIELRPESPKGRVELPVPGDLLKPGYNECVFIASLLSTEEFCESPNNASLWTTLEMETATVEIRYGLKPIPPRLSAISGFLFDKRMFLGTDVNIVLPEFTENTMRQAAIAASGAALRLDYQAARTRVSNALVPGMDNIVVGDAEFARKVLGKRAPAIGESTMAILPGEAPGKPGTPDPDTAVILLSGSPAGVDKAVRAFSFLSFPFPDTPTADLNRVSEPDPGLLDLKDNINRDKEYTFRSLGFFSKTIRAEWGKIPSVNLDYTFPSGLELNPNTYVTLSLHLTYAPGMRHDSVLAVLVNDIFVGGVHLDDVKGGTFLDYRINLPLFVMKKGANRLTLKPMLTPLRTAQCEYMQTENLLVTLFDDSTLSFPDIPLWVKLPDLGLFYQDAFPYAMRADLRDTTMLLGGKDADTLSAAVNLAAQLSQRTGLAPIKLSFSFGPEVKGNVIAVGAVDNLPKSLVEPASFSLLPAGQRPYPQMPRPMAQEDEAASHKAPLWSKYLPFLWEKKRKHQQITEYVWTDVSSGAALSPGKGFMTQYKTPGTAADTVTIFTGATPADVAGLATRLWEPAVRTGVSGDFAMIDLESVKPKAFSMSLGEPFYIGKIGAVPKLTLIVNTYPWTSLLVALGVLLLFSWAALRALRAVRSSRR